MRWTELRGKEIIDISSGDRLGTIGDADMVFDEQTGEISAILVPNHSGFFGFGGGGKQIQIPWSSIEKIGPEVVIVESVPNKIYR